MDSVWSDRKRVWSDSISEHFDREVIQRRALDFTASDGCIGISQWNGCCIICPFPKETQWASSMSNVALSKGRCDPIQIQGVLPQSIPVTVSLIAFPTLCELQEAVPMNDCSIYEVVTKVNVEEHGVTNWPYLKLKDHAAMMNRGKALTLRLLWSLPSAVHVAVSTARQLSIYHKKLSSGLYWMQSLSLISISKKKIKTMETPPAIHYRVNSRFHLRRRLYWNDSIPQFGCCIICPFPKDTQRPWPMLLFQTDVVSNCNLIQHSKAMMQRNTMHCVLAGGFPLISRSFLDSERLCRWMIIKSTMTI